MLKHLRDDIAQIYNEHRKEIIYSLLYALLGAIGAFILVLSESRVSGEALNLEDVLKSMLLGGVSANFGIWILFPVDITKFRTFIFAVLCGFSFNVVISQATSYMNNLKDSNVEKEFNASVEEVSKAEISDKEDLSRVSEHLQSGIQAVSAVRDPKTKRYLKDRLKFTFQKWAEKIAAHPEHAGKEFEKVYEDAKQVGLGEDLSKTTKDVAISNPEFLAEVANHEQVSQKMFGRVMIDKDVVKKLQKQTRRNPHYLDTVASRLRPAAQKAIINDLDQLKDSKYSGGEEGQVLTNSLREKLKRNRR